MSVGDDGTDLNEIDLEALRWIQLMERGVLSTEQKRQREAWIAADIKHKGAFIRAQAASLHLDRLAALAGDRSMVAPLPPRVETHWRRRLSIAAVLAVVGLVGVGTWLGPRLMYEVRGGTRYVSEVGEVKKVSLTDGSMLTINTQSDLRVHYTPGHRDVRLDQGEALFTVAHDTQRPFSVHVGNWNVVAVGTAFAVRRLDSNQTTITVTEGVVELRPAGGGAGKESLRIAANYGAIVNSSGRVEVHPIPASEIARQLAWRTSMVVFAGEPLRQAIDEMNRYSRRKIVINDPNLAERRIDGVFPINNTQTFVSGMQATLGVEAVYTGDVVLLRSVN